MTGKSYLNVKAGIIYKRAKFQIQYFPSKANFPRLIIHVATVKENRNPTKSSGLEH